MYVKIFILFVLIASILYFSRGPIACHSFGNFIKVTFESFKNRRIKALRFVWILGLILFLICCCFIVAVFESSDKFEQNIFREAATISIFIPISLSILLGPSLDFANRETFKRIRSSVSSLEISSENRSAAFGMPLFYFVFHIIICIILLLCCISQSSADRIASVILGSAFVLVLVRLCIQLLLPEYVFSATDVKERVEKFVLLYRQETFDISKCRIEVEGTLLFFMTDEDRIVIAISFSHFTQKQIAILCSLYRDRMAP
jgi:hypothetical protein